MEVILLIAAQYFSLHLCGHPDRIAIHFKHVANRNLIFACVEISEVSEQEAQRITNAAIAFHHALENLVRNGEFARVVCRGNPKT